MGRAIEDQPQSFGKYFENEVIRMASLEDLLNEMMVRLCDIESINAELREKGRADLTITHRVQMKEFASVEDLARNAGNFGVNFGFLNFLMNPNAASPLDKLAAGMPPRVLFGDYWRVAGHASKPSFQRMLVLAPKFTQKLVTEASPMEEFSDSEFKSEIFVAYQIMSGLVDLKDPNVFQRGREDVEYLCH